jgi:hypothetical protein
MPGNYAGLFFAIQIAISPATQHNSCGKTSFLTLYSLEKNAIFYSFGDATTMDCQSFPGMASITESG